MPTKTDANRVWTSTRTLNYTSSVVTTVADDFDDATVWGSVREFFNPEAGITYAPHIGIGIGVDRAIGV